MATKITFAEAEERLPIGSLGLMSDTYDMPAWRGVEVRVVKRVRYRGTPTIAGISYNVESYVTVEPVDSELRYKLGSTNTYEPHVEPHQSFTSDLAKALGL